MCSYCLYAYGFRFYFTPLAGVLFAFPSRYWFTIGRQLVFSLGGWSPHIQTTFHVRRPTHIIFNNLSRTGLSPTMATLSRVFRQINKEFKAAPRSLAATKGISVDFFSSGYLDVSVLRVRFLNLCIQLRITCKQVGFSHSEILGSKLVYQLAEAYRRFPRPSSPSTAQASTICAYSLDHITPNSLLLDLNPSAVVAFVVRSVTYISTLLHSLRQAPSQMNKSLRNNAFDLIFLSTSRQRLRKRLMSITLIIFNSYMSRWYMINNITHCIKYRHENSV